MPTSKIATPSWMIAVLPARADKPIERWISPQPDSSLPLDRLIRSKQEGRLISQLTAPPRLNLAIGLGATCGR